MPAIIFIFVMKGDALWHNGQTSNCSVCSVYVNSKLRSNCNGSYDDAFQWRFLYVSDFHQYSISWWILLATAVRQHKFCTIDVLVKSWQERRQRPSISHGRGQQCRDMYTDSCRYFWGRSDIDPAWRHPHWARRWAWIPDRSWSALNMHMLRLLQRSGAPSGDQSGRRKDCQLRIIIIHIWDCSQAQTHSFYNGAQHNWGLQANACYNYWSLSDR